MKKIAVYGSLRKGEYNHAYYSKNWNVVNTVVKRGYEMRSFGGYPAVIRKGRGRITVELCEVPDEVYADIDRMEQLAGYEPATLRHKGEKYTIWLYESKHHFSGFPVVISGDWVEYKKLLNKVVAYPAHWKV